MSHFQNVSKENKRARLSELMVGDVSPERHKAIGTIMSRKNLSYEKARRLQAFKILEIEEKDLKDLPRPKLSKK